ncbi:nuclear transport factor 2 family protein [Nocardia brasiliensis]|uniref:nuclear transport factor 2 family protein n=1 Tax=Nocardia brasiliensis TaxID=37326 RepID=UPI0004A75D44|nr:nuclear transport factor 2 family protein [Nocardia brasiliensis]MBF6125943.1 nuclear transport factor 2 family protein [Nocardia brasiliensis]
MADTELLNELLAVERKGWDSLCDSTGADFYGALMTGDAVMVLANGMILDRPGVVAALRDSPPWRTYEIRDPRLVDVGVHSKILVYTGLAYRDADTPAFTGLMSSVYLRAGGEWKLALYQQTEITG